MNPAVGDLVELLREVRLYGRNGKPLWYEKGRRGRIVETGTGTFGPEYRVRFARHREPWVRPMMDGLNIFRIVSAVELIAEIKRRGAAS